jgi:hypothetical protein
MDRELWGVFFEGEEGETFLTATFEDQEDATDHAREEDQWQFRYIALAFFHHPLKWEDFDGMHYVEPVAADLAAEARDELERGFVVRVE